MDLSIEKQTKFISKLAQKFTNDKSLFVIGARWRWPCKPISKIGKYDVELHDVGCGRFGLPLKFNRTVPVHCTENNCEEMCLYLNATVEPFTQMIDECSEYVITKPKNTFLHSIGCPEGYYRIEFDYVANDRDSCFSIETFSPIAVPGIDANVTSNCDGTIMNMDKVDDLYIFRKLSEQLGLTDEDYCLFSLTSNQIIEYSDWDSNYASLIPYNISWDKTMNYSRVNDSTTKSYLAVQPNGQWTWAVDSVSCIVCMVQSPIPFPKLELKYNILERSLELAVTDQYFLIKEKSSDLGFICFSVFRDFYKANLTVSNIAYGKYLIEDAGLGQYWCSGHNVMYRNFQWNGDIIFAYGIWFAFKVTRKCSNCFFDANEDLTRFIELFEGSNDYVSVRGSTIVEHGLPQSGEYSFIALLSLTLHGNVVDNLVPNLVNLTEYQLETAFIFENLNNWLKVSDDMTLNSIRSTEYCLPESTTSINAIIWGVARMGETVSTSPLCLFHSNDLLITRTCSGDSVNGSHWIEAVNAAHCYTVVSESLQELNADFKDFGQTTNLLEYLEDLLSRKSQILMPIDVFLTSKILEKVAVIITDIQCIFSIYNALMQVDDNFLKISSSLNSINVLLEAFDNILLGHIKSFIIGSSEYQAYGNSSIKSTLIETYVLDPIVSGMSGLAVYKVQNSSELNSTTYSLRYIHPNETINDLVTYWNSDEDLIAGAYLSADTLTSFTNINIVLTVFFTDSLFQSANMSLENGIYKTNGKIISLSILRLDGTSNFSTEIPIFFESNQTNASRCGVSSFSPINGPGWSSHDCNLRQILISNVQSFALCECNHLTYFTRLGNSEFNKTTDKDKTLKIFTVITSSFSFLGTIGIFFTAALSREWRQKLSSKMLIHFSAAITLEMVFMIIIKFDVAGSNKFSCVALGTMLHYSILVMYVWTLIVVYFQLKFHDAVSNVSHLLLKLTIFGWAFPLFPVFFILIVDYSSYIPVNKDNINLCYPIGWAMYLGVVLPIFLIFLFNSIIFISVLISLYRGSGQEDEATTNHSKNKITFPQLFLFASVCLTLGLTCIFGLSSEILPNCYTLFSYLYCITATIQGLVLILFFIDRSVRSIWKNLVNSEDRSRGIPLVTWRCIET